MTNELLQWPPENKVPGFRATMTQYLAEVEALGYQFISLVGEALGLGPDAMDVFYGPHQELQHRGKIVKYPSLDHVSSDQGVGPHYDAGFLTFVS
jgi:isopenicillin N synthase-like dioxygenase